MKKAKRKLQRQQRGPGRSNLKRDGVLVAYDTKDGPRAANAPSPLRAREAAIKELLDLDAARVETK